MGLLDDAIREHLELKRRHGGSDEEIAQQEKEALGPVRRTANGNDDESPEAAAVAEDEEILEGELVPDDEAELEEALAPEEPPAAPDEPVARPPLEEPTGPALADFGADFDEVSDAPVADIEQPTEEWGFDDEEDDAEERAVEAEPDEDPLEDTPDFLQETPEHDRLWFEQKPPKDFDFDE